MTIFDNEGKVVADTRKSYETFYPQESYVEQNCDTWWEVIVEGIKEMIRQNGILPEEIKGIGVDGISWACIPIDREGKVLYPTMIWLDRRANEEAQWMKDTIGEDKLIALSGNPIDASYITPKMLWLKKHHPEVFHNTYKFLQSNAFIVYRLTGEISQDYSQAYGFHFFDMNKGVYNEDIAKQLGLSLDLVAPLRQCHDIVGGVSAEVAKLTGLQEGTPVVAGGLDAACCTLGAGVIHAGQTQEQGGQAGGMSIALDQPLIHPKLILGYHVIPNMWLLQGGTTGGGGSLNWFNREFGYEEKQIAIEQKTSSFALMSEKAERIQAGSEGLIFLPYMKGERSPLWSTKAKGVYYGLNFEKSKSHMVRATMEGVAYSLKHNIETALEVGASVGLLRSVGGSSNSQVWTQIKADVTNCVIEVPYSDYATTLGAAILAGVGVGLYKDFEEAVKKTVKVQKRYEPNPEHVKAYESPYQSYLKLSNLLKDGMWS
jgi:xylulokinase